MRTPRRRRIWIAGAALAATVGLATAAFMGSGTHTQSAAPQPHPPAAPEPTTPLDPVTLPPTPAVPSLSSTTNPDKYAAAIGRLVLGFDTRHFTPADYRRALRQEADPNLSGTGRDDLFATIDARIPADDLWRGMRRNEQWSQWSPQRSWEPAAWSQVVTSGYAQPGWVMRNVTGVQTIHYLDDDTTMHSSTSVPTLSVVMRCPAPGAQVDRCRLVLLGTAPVF